MYTNWLFILESVCSWCGPAPALYIILYWRTWNTMTCLFTAISMVCSWAEVSTEFSNEFCFLLPYHLTTSVVRFNFILSQCKVFSKNDKTKNVKTFLGGFKEFWRSWEIDLASFEAYMDLVFPVYIPLESGTRVWLQTKIGQDKVLFPVDHKLFIYNYFRLKTSISWTFFYGQKIHKLGDSWIKIVIEIQLSCKIYCTIIAPFIAGDSQSDLRILFISMIETTVVEILRMWQWVLARLCDKSW